MNKPTNLTVLFAFELLQLFSHFSREQTEKAKLFDNKVIS